MSLKDEIDKLILEKRQRLERADTKNLEFHELQKRRFAALRPVLDELAKTTDPTYLRVELTDTEAKIQLGTTHNDKFTVQTEWRVAPNSRIRTELPSLGPIIFATQPGFTVEQVSNVEDPDYDRTETSYTFETEAEVVEHILTRTTDLVALHQHINDKFLRHRAQKSTT